MKKAYVVLMLVALTLPGLALGANSFSTSFKDGKYEGTISSILPDLNGKKATMEVKHEGDNVVATVTYAGGKEVWSWNDKTLTQKELDPSNKVTMQYGATASKTVSGTEQTYNINCADKTQNKCDAGSDYRFYWTLKSNPEEIKYTVYGVDKKDMTNATATAKQRHTFTFKMAK